MSNIKELIKRMPPEVFIFIIWMSCVIIVNPLGEFPLNDDWAYAKSVLNMYETGKLTMENWPAMTLIGQVTYSALLCKLLGFSFFTLRSITLIIGLFGILAVFKLALFFTSKKGLALIAALSVMVNPLFFSLSFTFMTDVHFVSFLLFSIYYFFKYLNKSGILYIIIATFFSIISTLIRQPGVLVPLVFAITIFFQTKKSLDVLKHSLPFFITVCAIIFHSYWLKYLSPGASKVAGLNELFSSLIDFDFYKYLTIAFKTILYLGLFLVPFVLIFFQKIKNILKTAQRWAVIITITAPIAVLISASKFPVGNILFNIGLGPKLLKDAYWKYNINPQINHDAWLSIIKLISVAGCLMIFLLALDIITSLLKKFRNKTGYTINIYKLFCVLLFVGYFILLLMNKSYFDRYTIPLVILSILLLLPKSYKIDKKSGSIAAVIFSLYAFFSIGATHDYLSWNRSRWEAIHYLTQEKNIEKTEIDGGFEFNAWHMTGPWSKVCKDCKSWWFVNNDNYVISFGNIQGFQKLKAFYYPQFLSFQKDSIYVLSKDGFKHDNIRNIK